MVVRSGYRAAGAALLVLCQIAACSLLGSAGRPREKRFVLDDFETESPVRYGELEQGLPPGSRGEIEWRTRRCRRSGMEGRCLRLAYSFDSPAAEVFAFRIDLGGVDASDYDHVEVWLKGDHSSGYSTALRIGFRRPKADRPELVEDGTEIVTDIGENWQRIVVPLNRMSGIGDWSRVDAFFLALEARRATARSGAYLIDDLVLLRTGSRGPSIYDRVVPVKKRAWEEGAGGRDGAQALVRRRLTAWPRRLLVDRSELPATDREFLVRLASDTWRGLDALTDRPSGLPVDHVLLSPSLESPRSRIGDYTNVTNVGLHLMAVVAAWELGFLSREEALARLRTSLDTLESLERHEGFFFNYYDTVSLERTSNFLSFVDSSWLTAGLVIVRSAFPELGERSSRLIDDGDYDFFYDGVAEQMSHGYYVNVATRSEYHYGLLYTEARLGSLIAIGKGDVPERHWFRLRRTLPAEAEWQSQRPRGWRSRTVRGHRVAGGWYEWQGMRYVPSWGGSMFEALMPSLVLDERLHAPASLGRNGAVHALLQRRYALEVLRYPVWGLSPAATPFEDSYAEYGVKVLGTLGYAGGAVAPYAAALALEVAPESAIANLRRLARLYDIYGEYGFYDAVDPVSGEVAYKYYALDQAMILLSAANALKDRCIQKRFAADPIIEAALPMLRDEDFFD
ncbi:MAG: glucoamylase family protein [Candidatus Binatia bacterium]